MDRVTLLSTSSEKPRGSRFGDGEAQRARAGPDHLSSGRQRTPKRAASPTIRSDSASSDDKCQAHACSLLLFCREESERICEKCVVYGPHKSHDFVSVSELQKLFEADCLKKAEMLQAVERCRRVAPPAAHDAQKSQALKRMEAQLEQWHAQALKQLQDRRGRAADSIREAAELSARFCAAAEAELQPLVDRLEAKLNQEFCFDSLAGFSKAKRSSFHRNGGAKTLGEILAQLEKIADQVVKGSSAIAETLELSTGEESPRAASKNFGELSKSMTEKIREFARQSERRLELREASSKNSLFESQAERRLSLKETNLLDTPDKSSDSDKEEESPLKLLFKSSVTQKPAKVLRRLPSNAALGAPPGQQAPTPERRSKPLVCGRPPAQLFESVVLPPSPTLSPLNKLQQNNASRSRLCSPAQKPAAVLTARAEKLLVRAAATASGKIGKLLGVVSKSVVDLQLSNQNLSDLDLAMLIKHNKSPNRFIEVNLGGNELTSDGLSLLLHWIDTAAELAAVGAVGLRGNKVDGAGLELLVGFLNTHANALHDVDLRQNPLSPSEAQARAVRDIKLRLGTMIQLK